MIETYDWFGLQIYVFSVEEANIEYVYSFLFFVAVLFVAGAYWPLYGLSDEQTEYQEKDRTGSSNIPVIMDVADVPDARSLWSTGTDMCTTLFLWHARGSTTAVRNTL